MKNQTRHEGLLLIIGPAKHHNRHGNPCFVVKLDNFICQTEPDSVLGYKIADYDHKHVVGTIGILDGQRTLANVAQVHPVHPVHI